jgi:metallo-beta-lactamase class B
MPHRFPYRWALRLAAPLAAWGTLVALLIQSAAAASPAGSSDDPPCPSCEELNRPQAPFRIYGNTYYVGVHGLSAILITGSRGHILIDGGVAESAPRIAASIRTLGFKVEDVKLLLNTHVHHDHAGGLAGLQRLSGARVAATAPAAAVLTSGQLGPDDPQAGSGRRLEPLAQVTVVQDGATVHVGTLAVQAHLTAGHTPGGTSFTWTSCEHGRCVHMVYADSLTAISSPGYRFREHPEVVRSFEASFRAIEGFPCDVLLTPHPEAAGLWSRLEKSTHGGGDAAFIDPDACRRYVEHAREGLQQRLMGETPP